MVSVVFVSFVLLLLEAATAAGSECPEWAGKFFEFVALGGEEDDDYFSAACYINS